MANNQLLLFMDSRRNYLKMNKAEFKTVGLTALGGALEYYDFAIYALFAPYISQHFFYNTDPLVGTINTFAVFALGYNECNPCLFH
jgi:hypothetical protein